MYEYYQLIIPYVYFALQVLCVYAMYAYIRYMYKNDKSGKTDYENMSNLVLDDNLDSKTINTVVKK